ncbi:hypothetical protein RCH06_001877 [Polaromonas sp. CG_9.5]|uniref:hypothetical protein n=1 Tax=Polaromonas sp. CG_9.5 TaxID=3071705 RepID=UPI002DF9B2BA|nr:hypothetical protein [Polaromonas sp. CG_9.5]
MKAVLANLSENLRQCNEQLLSVRLTQDREHKAGEFERQSHARAKLKLEQVITSLRWWAVFDLIWMLRETLEPARYAWSYPSSWAYKLAAQSAYPLIVVCWFATTALLIAPLIVTLAMVPNAPLTRRCEGAACVGLFMGGIGYAVLSSFADRLDIPHVVDSYRGSATMLIVTGLLVACWHNSRVIRASKAPTAQGGVCEQVSV